MGNIALVCHLNKNRIQMIVEQELFYQSLLVYQILARKTHQYRYLNCLTVLIVILLYPFNATVTLLLF